MKQILIQTFTIFIYIFSCISCREICYENYGCFIDTYPFGGTLQRPLAFLPEKPEDINVSFHLFTRKSADNGEILNKNNLGNLFNSSLETKFIIHGFLDSKENWVIEMKDELLKLEDMNVVCVDWADGASTFYTQAVANTQLVGRITAEIISQLIINRNLEPSNLHIIGHSLGAHIAGYIASNYYNNITGIDRISGMDPASPYFEHTPPEVRLDQSDANYVDVIHADTSSFGTGFGLLPSIGDVDYYPNGGKNQPGCTVSNVLPADTCSHSAAYKFFLRSINEKCSFHSYACESYNDFQSGKCIQCANGECNRMGYWSNRNLEKGVLFLDTNSPYQNELPVCKQSYQIMLKSSDKGGNKQARGVFNIYLKTKNLFTDSIIMDNSETVFREGSNETILLTINEDLNEEIESILISYRRNFNIFFNEQEWIFEKIKIYSGSLQIEANFCPDTVFDHVFTEYRKC